MQDFQNNEQGGGGMAPGRRNQRWVLPLVVLVLLASAGFGLFLYGRSRHDLTGFLKERYGSYDRAGKYWAKGKEELRYTVCASRDITVKGEPHRLLAMCGELPEDRQYHAASGYVDLYVLKRTFAGFTPVAELKGIESGSFGTPGKVAAVRLGKDFYGFTEESGWMGQGYLNGYLSVYVPVGGSFRLALRFSSTADDTGANGDCTENRACTRFERTIEFVPGKGSGIYAARVTDGGYLQGKPVSAVHTLTYNRKKHAYNIPDGFKADLGF